MIFNVFAVAELILAAIPAGILYAILWYGLGWESAQWWATIVAAFLVVPMDFLIRLTNVFGGDDEDLEEDEEPSGGMGITALIFPSGGGHLMFIPMYVIGGLAGVGLAVGFFAG